MQFAGAVEKVDNKVLSAATVARAATITKSALKLVSGATAAQSAGVVKQTNKILGIASTESVPKVTDNFNRADGGLGANWTVLTGNTANAIKSNKVDNVDVGSGGKGEAYTGASFAADQYAEGKFNQPSARNYGGAVGVRFTVADSTGYFLYWGNSGNNVSIWKLNSAGSWSELVSSGALTCNTSDVWRLEVQGNLLLAFQNGTLVAYIEDNSFSSGYPGIWSYYGDNQLDDFAASDEGLHTIPADETLAFTEVATDSFSGGDGGLGANWTHHPGADLDPCAVTSGKVTGVHSVHCADVRTAESFNNDQYAEITLSTIEPWLGVVLRATDARFYSVFVYGVNDVRVYHYVDGSGWSQLGLSHTDTTWSNGDRLKASCRNVFGGGGVEIRIYKNDVEVWSYIDYVYKYMTGRPGINCWGDEVRMDDWKAGNVSVDGSGTSCATAAMSAAFTRTPIKVLTAVSTALSAIIARLTEKVFSSAATTAQGASIQKLTSISSTGSTVAQSASTTKQASKPLTSSTVAQAAAITRTTWKSLSAVSTAMGAAITRLTNKVLTSVSSALAGGIIKLTYHLFPDDIEMSWFEATLDIGPGAGAHLNRQSFTAALEVFSAAVIRHTNKILNPVLQELVGSDSFTYTDDETLEQNGNWAGGASFYGSFIVNSGRVASETLNDYTTQVWAGSGYETITADQYSSVKLTGAIADSSGVIVRINGTIQSEAFYAGMVVGANDYRIYMYDGAYWNLLASGSSVTWEVGDVLTLQVQDFWEPNTPIHLKMLKNGVEVLNTVVTFYRHIISDGYPGIIMYNNGGGQTLDDWAGGNLTGKPARPSLFSGDIPAAAALAKLTLKSMSAGLNTFGAALAKLTAIHLSAAATSLFSVTYIRDTYRTFTASITAFIGTCTKRTGIRFTAAVVSGMFAGLVAGVSSVFNIAERLYKVLVESRFHPVQEESRFYTVQKESRITDIEEGS